MIPKRVVGGNPVGGNPQAIVAVADPSGRETRADILKSIHTADCSIQTECEALGRLEAENRRPGADLRKESRSLITSAELFDWLDQSDRLANGKLLRGRRDLTSQRRLGILRYLEGEDAGFPVLQNYSPMSAGQDFWLLRLRDELEWLILPVRSEIGKGSIFRPVKDRLNHREARAILDWKASHLDMWLADRAHLVGGRILIESSRGVLFDTRGFMRWVYSLMN